MFQENLLELWLGAKMITDLTEAVDDGWSAASGYVDLLTSSIDVPSVQEILDGLNRILTWEQSMGDCSPDTYDGEDSHLRFGGWDVWDSTFYNAIRHRHGFAQ